VVLSVIMRRIAWIFFAALVFIGLCAFGLRVLAAPRKHTATNQADAATLLARATARTNIESPSSAPFVLFAKARYAVNQQSIEGTYALGWAAPNLYREDLWYGKIHETIIVSGGKIYRAGQDTPYANLWSRMIRRPLQWSLTTGARAKTRSQGEHYRSGAQLTCIVAGAAGTDERICLDPNNYEPFSDNMTAPSGKQSWTFAGYTSLAHAASLSQRFPTAITYKDDHGTSAELDIQSIAAVSGFQPNEFTPPAGATAQDLPGKTQ